MTRRKTLLWVLPFLILLPLIIGSVGLMVGPIEVGIWLLLIVAWFAAYFSWARYDEEA